MYVNKGVFDYEKGCTHEGIPYLFYDKLYCFECFMKLCNKDAGFKVYEV